MKGKEGVGWVGWGVVSNWPPPQEKLPSKNPALSRIRVKSGLTYTSPSELEWLELNTLFGKDVLLNMFSRIACRTVTGNEDKNAVLTKSSSDSNTKNPKRGSVTLHMISFNNKSKRQQKKPLVLNKNTGTQY